MSQTNTTTNAAREAGQKELRRTYREMQSDGLISVETDGEAKIVTLRLPLVYQFRVSADRFADAIGGRLTKGAHVGSTKQEWLAVFRTAGKEIN